MSVASNFTPNVYRIISIVTSIFRDNKARNLLWYSPSAMLTGSNFRLPNWWSFSVLLKSCIIKYNIIIRTCRSRIMLNLQRRWVLKSKYCPRWRDFKLVIPLNSFTTVRCTVTGTERLTLNIPSLGRQRCLPSWGTRRTPWFFCNFSTVWCGRLLKLRFLGFWNYNSVIQALLVSNILYLFISTEVSQ